MALCFQTWMIRVFLLHRSIFISKKERKLPYAVAIFSCLDHCLPPDDGGQRSLDRAIKVVRTTEEEDSTISSKLEQSKS